jgi:hypothetical protein
VQSTLADQVVAAGGEKIGLHTPDAWLTLRTTAFTAPILRRRFTPTLDEIVTVTTSTAFGSATLVAVTENVPATLPAVNTPADEIVPPVAVQLTF